jgi:hypothetical protein
MVEMLVRSERGHYGLEDAPGPNARRTSAPVRAAMGADRSAGDERISAKLHCAPSRRVAQIIAVLRPVQFIGRPAV